MGWVVSGDLGFYFLGLELNIWSQAWKITLSFEIMGHCLKMGLEK